MNSCDQTKAYWRRKFEKHGLMRSLPRDVSPLRYPGGKGSLKYFLANVVIDNRVKGGHLIEPFCGGAGATLPILFSGIVDKIWMNDLHPGIYAFWYAVLNHPDKFIEEMYRTPITIDKWKEIREASSNSDQLSTFEYGFSTFFLNRTNRSGLIFGGPIGGIDQMGKYKLDCRFNKENLEQRILNLAKHSHQIELVNSDAIKFMKSIPSKIIKKSLIFMDPPYVQHGYNIYRGYSFKREDHVSLANFIKDKKWRWIITYDDNPLIHELYAKRRKDVLEYSYYMQRAKIGRELILSSSMCRLDLASRAPPLSSRIDSEATRKANK